MPNATLHILRTGPTRRSVLWVPRGDDWTPGAIRDFERSFNRSVGVIRPRARYSPATYFGVHTTDRDLERLLSHVTKAHNGLLLLGGS